jgi:hypothetical protein
MAEVIAAHLASPPGAACLTKEQEAAGVIMAAE